LISAGSINGHITKRLAEIKMKKNKSSSPNKNYYVRGAGLMKANQNKIH
jgi:hypothetical protein